MVRPWRGVGRLNEHPSSSVAPRARASVPERGRRAAALLLAIVLLFSGCSSSPGAHASSGEAVRGGTAYFAEQPLEPPTYIFPLVSDEYYTAENTSYFQTLLYEPLYWFGNDDRATIDYALSIGNAPRYSDEDRVVTITLKRYLWSDGEEVSARDVEFWIDLVKANPGEWASYVPGGFPDDIRSVSVLGPRTVRLGLDRSYNPTWFTYNELSQITPLPLAWDRTSKKKRAGAFLSFTTTAGARAVYAFLNSEAGSPSSYASSPIWSVVDGPWRLEQLTAAGRATFVPNRRYSGPDRPRLSRFVELPFTSADSEVTVLKASSAVGGPGTTAPQVSLGYLPDDLLPQAHSLSSAGYRIVDWFPFQFDYLEPNFHSKSVGPIFDELYFRQAFQHLIDQPAWIKAFYHGLAVPTYSPVPAEPKNSYSDPEATRNPYPYSLRAARDLLVDHGWTIDAGGITRCSHPGLGPGRCGAGIRKGEGLVFGLLYPSGLSYTDDAMVELQSVAREVGIDLVLKEATANDVAGTVDPCPPSCGWEIGQYGTGWLFAPDHYPTGEEIFETGALGNVADYSSQEVDRLIAETTTAPPRKERSALDAYANYVRLQVPNFWQPSPGIAVTVQANLHGFVPNAYGFINPEQWYFTKS